MANKKSGWSYSAGEHGRNRVRAYLDGNTDTLFLEWREAGKRKRLALGHTDKAKAKQQADTTAAEFATLCTVAKPVKLTLLSLFENYLSEKTPEKGQKTQKHERACAEMFLRYFGPNREPRTLSRQEWDRFVRDRREGKVAHSPTPSGRKVRSRAIAYDLAVITAVLNWATVAGDGSGGYLMDRNPFKGCPMPVEKSPTRATVTGAEYAKLLEAAGTLGWRYEAMLTLAHETGHRVGAIRRLRWTDVDMVEGVVNWPQHSDKIGMAHTTALTPSAIAAFELARSEGSSIGWVFPSPTDPGQPCSSHYVAKWWKKMEQKAGIEHRRGMGFHSLRRKFATDMKDAPLSDLLVLGGWKNPQTVIRCYQAAPTKMRQLDVLSRRASAVS